MDTMSGHTRLNIGKMFSMNRLRTNTPPYPRTNRTPAIAPKGHNNLLAPLPPTEPHGEHGINRDGKAVLVSKWDPAWHQFPANSLFGRVGKSGAQSAVRRQNHNLWDLQRRRMPDQPLILRNTPC